MDWKFKLEAKLLSFKLCIYEVWAGIYLQVHLNFWTFESFPVCFKLTGDMFMHYLFAVFNFKILYKSTGTKIYPYKISKLKKILSVTRYFLKLYYFSFE